MPQTDPGSKQVDEDQLMKSQMEQMVGSYDSYMRKMTLGRERVLRDRTVRLAQVKPGDAVLEVGCGTGSLTLAAKRAAGPTGQVTGIDILPGMIEASRLKAAKANEDITFQIGSVDAIPFSENEFDVAMCSFMIFHMSDHTRQRGIAEVYRVLKPNGRLLVLDLALPPQRIQQAIVKRLFGSMLQHDLQELRPLMTASGFADVESGGLDFRILGLSVLGFVSGRAEKS
jgi:ubiquinone/menaquinone biosynthesis C-methylase UbiE